MVIVLQKNTAGSSELRLGSANHVDVAWVGQGWPAFACKVPGSLCTLSLLLRVQCFTDHGLSRSFSRVNVPASLFSLSSPSTRGSALLPTIEQSALDAWLWLLVEWLAHDKNLRVWWNSEVAMQIHPVRTSWARFIHGRQGEGNTGWGAGYVHGRSPRVFPLPGASWKRGGSNHAVVKAMAFVWLELASAVRSRWASPAPWRREGNTDKDQLWGWEAYHCINYERNQTNPRWRRTVRSLRASGSVQGSPKHGEHSRIKRD